MDIEITLTTLTYGGEAMGRHNGKAVFVPFALPGETVRARLVDERKNFARAKLLEVLKPAPERLTPRCIHFGVCGGCHYQHLSYADQLKAKTEILRDQLTRIGKLQAPPVQAMVASPAEWNYRNHIQFHLDENGDLGYIRADSPEAVLPIKECHLPEAALNILWPELDFAAGAPLERVSLRGGDELMLVLEADSPETPEMEIAADLSVVHLTDEDAVVIAGDDHLVIEVLGRAFKVSAGSFFQVNTAMAGKMVEHILSIISTYQSPASQFSNHQSTNSQLTILDIYCGVGLFSAFLAPHCQRLIGIELSAAACADYAVNLDEFDHVELYEAAAEEVLPVLVQNQPNGEFAVIVDPPRAGLEKNALDALVTLKPKLLVYVSCDPSTLARDAARLVAAGYKLKQVTPFDLFPQTYHIESISLFEK